jgi:hypothetical protein
MECQVKVPYLTMEEKCLQQAFKELHLFKDKILDKVSPQMD